MLLRNILVSWLGGEEALPLSISASIFLHFSAVESEGITRRGSWVHGNIRSSWARQCPMVDLRLIGRLEDLAVILTCHSLLSDLG